MRERIRNLYWSGSLHSDLHLQQPHAEVVSDESEKDMQFSASGCSQESVSRPNDITENEASLLIGPVDSNRMEGKVSRSRAVPDEEGSRYRQSKPRVSRTVDTFAEVEYVTSDSEEDDEGTMHYSSRMDEDEPPPKKKGMLQSRDVSPKALHTTVESGGSKVPQRPSRREYWARKAGSERLHQDP